MRKNPLLLSLLKLLVNGGILILLGFLYWSSQLVEQDLLSIKGELGEIKSRLEQAPLQPAQAVDVPKTKKEITSAFKNLLNPDPFYTKTLPNLLGDGFKPSGTRKLASVGKPENLHPFSNWAGVSAWQQLTGISVGKNRFGFFEQYSPSGAVRVEERPVDGSNDIEYWVYLREDVFWEPLKQQWFSSQIKLSPHFLKRHKVTAHDYKLYFDAAMNPFVTAAGAIPLKEIFSDIVEVKVIDDYTFTVRWKTYPIQASDGSTIYRAKYLAKSNVMSFSPLAGFVYTYYPDGKKIVENDKDPETYRTNSTFAQVFMEHWAKNVLPSCGAMRFEGMNDQGAQFSRNPNYYAPLGCLVSSMDVVFKQIEENVWQSFKQGEIDSHSLAPSQRAEFENFKKSANYSTQEKEGLGIKELDFVSRSYAYIGWNEARPLFQSKKVRRALTMAIDRKRIIEEFLGGMGIEMSCPFYPFSTAYDDRIAPWPFDPREAKRLLEEEGFADLDGDGILEKKEGDKILKFEFSLTYFSKNSTTKSICEYVATALKEIGIKCNLMGVDIADLSLIFDEKNFDAYTLYWALTDPPEDPRQLWHSSNAGVKGSSNPIGFKNAEVDQIIDMLTYEADPLKRQALYHRFDAIFHEEAPYTLIYTPKAAFLYRDYLKNVFLPIDRQDLIPGATVAEPSSSIMWIKKR